MSESRGVDCFSDGDDSAGKVVLGDDGKPWGESVTYEHMPDNQLESARYYCLNRLYYEEKKLRAVEGSGNVSRARWEAAASIVEEFKDALRAIESVIRSRREKKQDIGTGDY